MTKEVKIKVLSINSLTHLTVKEMETEEAMAYEKFEDKIQKIYSISDDIYSKNDLEIGSYVCVNVSINSQNRRSPKKWLRAVIRQILQTIGTYLFNVYLLDYGIETMVNSQSVRQLKSLFTDEFVRYQAMSFHLSDIELKPSVNSEENLIIVQKLLESNNNLVFADISKETNTNILGNIRFNDGSDLNQFLIDKGLAVKKVSAELRSPKTLPFFKTIKNQVNGTQLNSNSFIVTNNRNASNSSISSISSTEISMSSNSSSNPVVINSSEEEDVMNGGKQTPKNSSNSSNVGKGRFSQLFTRIKLKKQMQEMSASNGETVDSVRSESPIDYVNYFKSKPQEEEELNWPLDVNPNKSQIKSCNFRPAGALPPTHVLERIFTLKKKQNNFEEDFE